MKKIIIKRPGTAATISGGKTFLGEQYKKLESLCFCRRIELVDEEDIERYDLSCVYSIEEFCSEFNLSQNSIILMALSNGYSIREFYVFKRGGEKYSVSEHFMYVSKDFYCEEMNCSCSTGWAISELQKFVRNNPGLKYI